MISKLHAQEDDPASKAKEEVNAKKDKSNAHIKRIYQHKNPKVSVSVAKNALVQEELSLEVVSGQKEQPDSLDQVEHPAEKKQEKNEVANRPPLLGGIQNSTLRKLRVLRMRWMYSPQILSQFQILRLRILNRRLVLFHKYWG
ncbi:hypothetical protein ACH5RR_029726 [Cinchona calisaya]|uniref:Uncharacterized protein n=1 Tax=Cinchona calisaya TaxID=153742 RepID=A0ABD2YWB2_9GENT